MPRAGLGVLAVVVAGSVGLAVAVPVVANAQAARSGAQGAGVVAGALLSPSPSPSPTSSTIVADDGTSADTITCTLNVQNPHNSTHVPENVNVVDTISCTASVTSLSISVALLYDGSQVATGANSNAGSKSIKTNAATPCEDGDYEAVGGGTVVFPPGYTPPSGQFPATDSGTVTIKC